ncbi:putative glycine dehydrogenase (decarboxylating) subunit 1 [Synergistales bacterium]|nr:putative glycine dehydrogenase (decarboxylating) subunit 1 [Synergistales bacterium]
MSRYVPATSAEQQEMLAAIGLRSFDELFSAIPAGMTADKLNIPAGQAELSVRRRVEGAAGRNKLFRSIFRGGGAYNHYIPALVKQIASNETFVTAYTPYQAEISQGILQSIFEYQTMMCELTGLDVSNASVYDGATAAAEAAAMCLGPKRNIILVSGAANPMVIDVIRTYSYGSGAELKIVPAKDGVTDAGALASVLDGAACLYVQQPNYFGLIEDAEALGAAAHEGGAKFVMGVHPIAAAILKSAGESGADIAVGDAQPLGMPLSFGGPYLGFMTAVNDMARKLPGRIAGETADIDGKRAFVLTLQAREQHIRREKASSNICSNQALCALTAAVYLTVMGPSGLADAARQCASKAHYAAEKICSVDGFDLVYGGEFFNEFVTSCPAESGALMKRLGDRGILGGLPVDGGILWCATEMNTKDDIDELVNELTEALKEAVR